MANSEQAAAVAQRQDYQSRVAFYGHKAAHAVMAELGTVPNHTERVAWANSMLNGSESIPDMAVSTVTNSTIQASADATAALQGVSDSDLEFAVNSMVDAWAGAPANP